MKRIATAPWQVIKLFLGRGPGRLSGVGFRARVDLTSVDTQFQVAAPGLSGTWRGPNWPGDKVKQCSTNGKFKDVIVQLIYLWICKMLYA